MTAVPAGESRPPPHHKKNVEQGAEGQDSSAFSQYGTYLAIPQHAALTAIKKRSETWGGKREQRNNVQVLHLLRC
jgi:hypothetical protein